MNISSYTHPLALGHKALALLTAAPVDVEEKVDGCVSLDTPVLKADLTYTPAGLLQVGDELVGFDDTLNDPRLRKSVVTAAKPIKKPCVVVDTSAGPITVSEDHPFLVRQTTNNNGKRWVKAKDLLPGAAIVFIGRWRQEHSWESGYLAGMFDGEGSLVVSGNSRVLSFYQKTGPELQRVEELLARRGFRFSVDVRQREAHHKQVGSLVFRTYWPEILRFLGTTRPERLVAKSLRMWDGAALNGVGTALVQSIAPSRVHSVMGLSTSTKTYVADGFLSHNSQFSFGKYKNAEGEIELVARSRGAGLQMDIPEKMFAAGIAMVKELEPLLTLGWTYRGEYLNKPKHNTLYYERIPVKNIIIFDIERGPGDLLTYEEKKEEADRIGLETVPRFFSGMLTNPEVLRDYLDNTSILGGQKIEGVVVKRAAGDLWGENGKALAGKLVSESFKEIHGGEWKKENPSQGDVISRIIKEFATPARYSKAVQHLKEAGKIEGSPRDIGALIKEVREDVEKEGMEEIRERLWNYAWPQIERGLTGGLPAWYKEELLKAQFSEEPKSE